jgi:hypothetical protein
MTGYADDLADFTVQNEGTVFLLQPLTEAACQWTEEYLPGDAQRFGSAYVVEHRYIRHIIDGIMADGLTVN